MFVHTLYVLVNVSITLSPNISLPTHAAYTSVVLYVIFSLHTWSLGVISLNHLLPHKKQCCVLFSVYFYILCLINDNGHPNNRTPTIMLLDFTAALFNNAFYLFIQTIGSTAEQYRAVVGLYYYTSRCTTKHVFSCLFIIFVYIFQLHNFY